MNKRRLLHIITSLKIGGAESLLVDMVERLKTDFDQDVIYFHDGPNVERIKKLGVPVYKISGFVSLYDPLFFKRLYSFIKLLHPDLIHTALWAANFSGRIIGKKLNIPVINSVHLGVNQDGVIRNILDKYTFGMATRAIAVSHDVAKTISHRQFITKDRVDVIHNGVHADDIVKRALVSNIKRQDIGLEDDHEVLGSVGRFIPRKQYSLLLDSFALIAQKRPKARLILIGIGPEENKLRQKAQKLGIDSQVLFIIGQPAYGYFPLFDCFVLSSVQEGVSIALLEAMSFALPCIVTSPDEKHEVIESGKNGIVVCANDCEALSVTMSNVLREKYMSKKLGLKALETVSQKFTMKRMVDSYRKVFLNLN